MVLILGNPDLRVVCVCFFFIVQLLLSLHSVHSAFHLKQTLN